jgi:hypothetical protein
VAVAIATTPFGSFSTVDLSSRIQAGSNAMADRA